MSSYDLQHALAVASRVNGLDAKIVALLHDAVEDEACSLADLRDALPEEIVAAVVLLTRRDASYADYIAALNESGNELAIHVKAADLETNLARMDEKHASLSSRYRKALSVLNGTAA